MHKDHVSLWRMIFPLLLALTGCGGGSETVPESGSSATTYTVTYEGNGSTGGSVPVDSAGYEQGSPVTVLGNTNNLSQSGFSFSGWNTASDGSGTAFVAGNQFNMGSADLFLYAQWSANPINVTVPAPRSFELVDTSNYGLSLQTITQGSEVDLTALPAVFNFTVEFTSNPGSVKVDLACNGLSVEDRYENNAIYTVAPQGAGDDLTPADLSLGSCTLSATPYELADLNGEQGATLTVDFTVVDTTPPTVPDPNPQPVAVDDHFTTTTNSALNDRSVTQNDTIDAAKAIYSAPSATASGGVLVMGSNGSFSYTPPQDFSGSDSFDYEVVQNGHTASATVTIQVFGDSASSGFTPIVPSADTRIIYVSSSEGDDDTNDCLSEAQPCKTLAAAFGLIREGYPDHVLLKRGDAWRGETLRDKLKSGRSKDEPAVLSYYGDSGPRPRLELDGPAYTNSHYILKHFHLIGIELASYKLVPGSSDFTGVGLANFKILGGSENLLFEDNLFTCSELKFSPWDSDGDTVDEGSVNLVIRRNIFTGAYVNDSSYKRAGSERPSNLYAAGTEGLLIEENVLDYGGWNPTVADAGANQLNHNMYIQYSQESSNLIVRNNIVTRGSSHGIQGRPGGVYEDNFIARNSVGLSLGYPDRPLTSGIFAIARNNVIVEGESMAKGINACSLAGLCTRALWGLRIGTEDVGGASVTAEGNIIAGLGDNTQALAHFGNLVEWGFTDQSAVDALSGNIEWNWTQTPDYSNPEGYVDPGRTLGGYNASIGGTNDFDAFMNIAKSRPLHTWDERYTAKSINDYIRAGYAQ